MYPVSLEWAELHRRPSQTWKLLSFDGLFCTLGSAEKIWQKERIIILLMKMEQESVSAKLNGSFFIREHRVDIKLKMAVFLLDWSIQARVRYSKEWLNWCIILMSLWILKVINVKFCDWLWVISCFFGFLNQNTNSFFNY